MLRLCMSTSGFTSNKGVLVEKLGSYFLFFWLYVIRDLHCDLTGRGLAVIQYISQSF